jgi:hypothetical protein
MTRPTFSEIVGTVFLAGLLIICWDWFYTAKTECAARGGVLMRGALLWECIDAKALK